MTPPRIPPPLQKNVTLMYLRDEDRVALRDNLVAFIERGTKR